MNAAPRQLLLNLPVETAYGREDFLVSPSNQMAWDMFEQWPDWHDRLLLLVGPSGSGKTHLASIWAEKAQARRLPAAALQQAHLEALAASPAILLEDADAAEGIETALFHLINLVRASGAALVVTARAFPGQWGLKTADLLSRLRLVAAAHIEAPDDALVRAVLVKQFVDRQLAVDAGFIEYLATRIEPSLEAARAAVEALDRKALALGRPVTRQLAGEWLRSLDAPEN